jgi:chromosome segregation ATPase
MGWFWQKSEDFRTNSRITDLETDIITVKSKIKSLTAITDELELHFQQIKTKHLKAMKGLNRFIEKENEKEEEDSDDDDEEKEKTEPEVDINDSLGFGFLKKKK